MPKYDLGSPGSIRDLSCSNSAHLAEPARTLANVLSERSEMKLRNQSNSSTPELEAAVLELASFAEINRWTLNQLYEVLEALLFDNPRAPWVMCRDSNDNLTVVNIMPMYLCLLSCYEFIRTNKNWTC